MAGKTASSKPKEAAKTAVKGRAIQAGPGAKAKGKEPDSIDEMSVGRHPGAGPVNKGPELPVKPLRPSQCRGFMRKRIAEEFPKIVHGFLEEAKTGNCAHVKLASDLLEKPAAKGASRKKGSAERMLEELRAL